MKSHLNGGGRVALIFSFLTFSAYNIYTFRNGTFSDGNFGLLYSSPDFGILLFTISILPIIIITMGRIYNPISLLVKMSVVSLLSLMLLVRVLHPKIQGVYFSSRIDGLTHLHWINQISNSGDLPGSLIYPPIHVLTYTVSDIMSISVISAAWLIMVIFSLIIVITSAIIIKNILPENNMPKTLFICFFIVILLPFGRYHSRFFPMAMSAFYFGFFIYVVMLYNQNPTRRSSVLVLLPGLFLSTSHPINLIAISTFLLVISIERICQFQDAKFIKTTGFSTVFSAAIILITILVVWIEWNFHTRSFEVYITRLARAYFGLSGSTEYSNVGSSSVPMIENIIRSYSIQIVFASSTLSLLYYIRTDNKGHRGLPTLFIWFILFSSLSIFLVFGTNFMGIARFSYGNYSLWVAIVSIILIVEKATESDRIEVQSILVLLIIVMLMASFVVTNPSSFTYETTDSTSYDEVRSTEWVNNYSNTNSYQFGLPTRIFHVTSSERSDNFVDIERQKSENKIKANMRISQDSYLLQISHWYTYQAEYEELQDYVDVELNRQGISNYLDSKNKVYSSGGVTVSHNS